MKLWKLMMTGVVALGLAGAATVSATPVTAHASDNITIDGKFSDWDGTSLTEGYSGYTALKSNGKYIDVYVKMKNGQVPGHGDYIFKIGGKTYHAWFADIGSQNKGVIKSFTVTGGSNYDGTQYGTIGAGYASNDGNNNLGEFRIDLSKFGLKNSDNGDQVTMTNSNIGSDAAKTTVDDMSASDDANATSGVINGKADSSSKATTTTDTNASNDNDNLNITIDGKFADWKGVTLTEGYNGYTAMVSDGDKVYFYVKMKYGTVPGYGDYNFDFNGKKIYIWTDEINGGASADHPQKVNLTGGDYNEGHQYGTVGDGYVSSEDGHSIAEFEVDLSKLNLSSMTGQTITMYNPNIGNEKVTVAGGSTGPYVISGIGLGIAGLGYWRLRKSGKLKRREHKTAGK
ncbi:Firmicu-CTERM sorting domain-containing protein [Levilactobacillus suantsaiihabitans]|uniref:Firmicu-CTERM sorting domain-containing protein n=1 Tax=Levilactobacillus suantsaiihabitans TaxID=2487722 RepID=A0A4Z0JDC4_9LACO|nr:Firmicu-CTERM sorting domain-containing protein [Levilactobacillus suantsaiihabitans]TGD20462.1 Firmicu-CTERM sorting domain-containing protein [Levilactobacillus suantsaiihabitans]